MNHPGPFQRKIELLAYELWQERGRPWGTPETDWYKAERELTGGKPEGALSRLAREVGTAIGTAVGLVTDLAVLGEPEDSLPNASGASKKATEWRAELEGR